MQAPASEVYLPRDAGRAVHQPQGAGALLGLEDRWHEVAQMYADVNQMFGDIVKVTPSSKVVGDMALMMVSQGLTRADVEDPEKEVAFPDSVIDMMRGNLGQPPGGFPPGILKKVLKDEQPDPPNAPASTCHPSTWRPRAPRSPKTLDVEIDDEDLMGYMMYPKVFTDYATRHKDYGPVRTLPTRTFFYGMEPGEEIEAEIDPGKTLVIRLSGRGRDQRGGRGARVLRAERPAAHDPVPNRKIAASQARRPKAEAGNPNHVGAPMPGVVATVAVRPARRSTGRPAADHRGDEDGNRPPRRTRRGGQGRACHGGRADRRQGPAGGVRRLNGAR
jgi:pyruvate carboxylase